MKITTAIKPPWQIGKPRTLILFSLPQPFRQTQNPQNSAALPHTDSGLLFRQKILYLEHHLRVDSRKALALNPAFRAAPLSAVKSVAACLASMGLDRAAASPVLDMHPALLTADLYPVHDVGLSFPEVSRALFRCPRLPRRRPAPPQPRLPRLPRLHRRHLQHRPAPRLQRRAHAPLQARLPPPPPRPLRLRRLLSLGLLTLSLEKNLSPKVDFFLGEMRGDASELRRFPQYFSFSLERRIQPRHRALAELGFAVPLPEMLKVSDGEFAARLVEMRLRRVDERR